MSGTSHPLEPGRYKRNTGSDVTESNRLQNSKSFAEILKVLRGLRQKFAVTLMTFSDNVWHKKRASWVEAYEEHFKEQILDS